MRPKRSDSLTARSSRGFTPNSGSFRTVCLIFAASDQGSPEGLSHGRWCATIFREEVSGATAREFYLGRLITIHVAGEPLTPSYFTLSCGRILSWSSLKVFKCSRLSFRSSS